MVNYEFETPNATFGWDNTLGEFGQPFVQLVKDVHAGEEIFANYGPWFAYLRHGFTRRIFDDAVAKRGRKTLDITPLRSKCLLSPSWVPHQQQQQQQQFKHGNNGSRIGSNSSILSGIGSGPTGYWSPPQPLLRLRAPSVRV